MSKKARKLKSSTRNEAETAKKEMDKLSKRLKIEEARKHAYRSNHKVKR